MKVKISFVRVVLGEKERSWSFPWPFIKCESESTKIY